MLSFFCLIAALALLIYLTIRGASLLVAAPVTALLVAASAALPLLAPGGEKSFLSVYMGGFSGFVTTWFFMFLLGSIFGKIMEDCGAADSVSRWLLAQFGPRHAAFAVVAACAVLTYGGVSVFVVAFSAYPMALALFRQANLPRRLIPATLSFGSVTFTMTSAGSPEIQNWIPIKYLGTTPYAGWQVSLVVAAFMAIAGMWLLRRMLARAGARGETFVARDGDPQAGERVLPHPLAAVVPLATVLVVSFLLHGKLQENALLVALLAGCAVALLINFRYVSQVQATLGTGALGALLAIGNTAAVVGFGAVVQASPAFDAAVQAITHLPGDPLLSAAIAVTVIAGVTGSASGGQAIALPVLAPIYLDMGVNPEELHRVVAIASGALDSLPHNGYVVTTIRAICGETHRDAYPAVGVLTVLVPAAGTLLAILLFAIF